MPPKPHIFDGLWYLLRPALASRVLMRYSHTWALSKRYPSPPAATSVSRPETQCRSNTRTAIEGISNRGAAESILSEMLTERHDLAQSAKNEGCSRGEPGKAETTGSPSKGQDTEVKEFDAHRRAISRLANKETGFLEARLEEMTTKSPDLRNVVYILHVLVGQRHIPPAARHYQALIMANRDPKHGSAAQVRSLLAEMETNGIAISSAVLHAALHALAVHPDYILQEEIIQTLRDRWLALSPDGWHWIVAGLIRQNQFELALDHMEQMQMKGIPIKNWLHALVIYSLCKIEDFDEVLRLMNSRVREGYDMSQQLWQHVLDAASEAFQCKLTHFVWMRMVELGYLRPAYGTCKNTLATASCEGDTQLANSVFRYFESIGVAPELEDYESMAETYLASGNLHSALEILCTMQKSGIELESSSTRSILTFMLMTKMQPRTAWSSLKQLKAKGYDIPISCANIVLELCEKLSLNNPPAVDEAVSFYKELYSLCASGTNAATFETLVSMCRRAARSDAAMFVIKEMAALGIVPSDRVFEDIIIMCLERHNFESAYHYFQDLVERGGRLSEEAIARVQHLCFRSPKQFASELENHPFIKQDRHDYDIDEKNRMILVRWRRLRRQRQLRSYAAGRARHNIQRARRRLLATKDIRIKSNKERRSRKRRVRAFVRLAVVRSWADFLTSTGQDTVHGDATNSTESAGHVIDQPSHG